MSRCGELNEGQSLLGRTKQRRSLLPPLSGSPPSPPGAPFDLANVSCLDAFFCSTPFFSVSETSVYGRSPGHYAGL